MSEEFEPATLRRKISSEQRKRADKSRELARDSRALTRTHVDRWRERMRRRHLDAWLDDTARKLGRPQETLRLLDIANTRALQDAQTEADYLQAIGELPGFLREVPLDRQEEVEHLLAILAARLPDSPIYILRGIDSFWMRSDQNEPGEEDIRGNASSYFGAIEATSAEVLTSAAAWIDGYDFVNTFISAANTCDGFALKMGNAHNGPAVALDLYGPQWGNLLADQQSDWTYTKWLEQAVKIRARRGIRPS